MPLREGKLPFFAVLLVAPSCWCCLYFLREYAGVNIDLNMDLNTAAHHAAAFQPQVARNPRISHIINNDPIIGLADGKRMWANDVHPDTLKRSRSHIGTCTTDTNQYYRYPFLSSLYMSHHSSMMAASGTRRRYSSILFSSKQKDVAEKPPTKDSKKSDTNTNANIDNNGETLVAFIPTPGAEARPAKKSVILEGGQNGAESESETTDMSTGMNKDDKANESNENSKKSAENENISISGVEMASDMKVEANRKLMRQQDAGAAEESVKPKQRTRSGRSNKKLRSTVTADKAKASVNTDKANGSSTGQSITSLGSFLLKRKQIEEDEIEKIKSDGDQNELESDRNRKSAKDGSGVNLDVKPPMSEFAETEVANTAPSTTVNTTGVQKDFDEALQKFASDAETTITSFIDTYNQNAVGEDSRKQKPKKGLEKRKELQEEAELDDGELGMDPEQIREVDESVSILTGSGSMIGRNEIMKDIDILSDAAASPSVYQGNLESFGSEKMLPLSDARHNSRIELDMRRLAVSIASGIENEEQWKTFCEDGGGMLPLLECIRDGAREIRQGPIAVNDSIHDASIHGIVGEREAAFDAACNACKTLRDLSVLSKSFSAIVTDGILRADCVWANKSKISGRGDQTLSGGVLSDLVIILKHSYEADNVYKQLDVTSNTMEKIRSRSRIRDDRNSRNQLKANRQRCALYVVQLLLAMSFASDKAVDRLRATDGFTDAVLSCSSYAHKERLRRRWIKYPMEVIKRKLKSDKSNNENAEDPFLAAASIAGGLSGKIQGVSNQLLAAIGYNEWYPKTAGQKGLRILCLDGGGTRGITAISSMRSIVDALGGIEVCDAFDMIAGTSTGAIIAFLVGLRRESSKMARKRYDKLIKRIFVKSALSTPMLLFTTATYDENPFNQVMSSILRDNSMLASRADPRVPLVFAISSKMSSTPTQLCLFRNYNYKRGEMSDAFVQDPIEAKLELELPLKDDIYKLSKYVCYDDNLHQKSEKPSQGSRHPGSFRVLQRAALRATTAAPTVFKPVLMGGELYCDGGIVASNPAAVAIHEARTIFPNVPIEMVVSCGTGAFIEEKSEPRIGWDGIIGQIVNSATDGEQTHHILEDILGQGSTAHLGKSTVSKTKYYRFNPVVGTADAFPIDGTDPSKLEELSAMTTAYMNEPEQKAKLDEIVSILEAKSRWRRMFD